VLVIGSLLYTRLQAHSLQTSKNPKQKKRGDNQRNTESLDEHKPAYCHMAVAQQWMHQNLAKCLKILGDKLIRPYCL